MVLALRLVRALPIHFAILLEMHRNHIDNKVLRFCSRLGEVLDLIAARPRICS